MGRPLFSQRYGLQPVATARLEPEHPVTGCPGKWSIHARFDPDSDEFFESAVFEAFTDKDGDAVMVQPDNASSDSPLVVNSPMAPGNPDSVATPSAPAPSGDLVGTDSAMQTDATEDVLVAQFDIDFDRDFLQWHNPEEYARRYPSSLPTTPPTAHSHLPMVSPSPPGTVTPRIYMWGGSRASPGSPTTRHTHSGALLLANSAARQSLARLPARRRVQNV